MDLVAYSPNARALARQYFGVPLHTVLREATNKYGPRIGRAVVNYLRNRAHRSRFASRIGPAATRGELPVQRLEGTFERVVEEPPVQRRRIEFPMNNQTIIPQVRRVKRRFGRKKKETLGRLWKRYKKTEISRIYRFQSLTGDSYVSGRGTFVLSKQINTEPAHLSLPAFCFNLTSVPHGYSHGPWNTLERVYSFPMYRLSKFSTNEPGKVNYLWSVVSGTNNNPLGQDGIPANRPGWSLESMDGQPNDLYNENYVVHDWSSINMILYGAKARPITFHCYLLRFNNNYAGPIRFCSTTNDEVTANWKKYDTENEGFDQVASDRQASAEADTYWDSYWNPKVIHPLSTSHNGTSSRNKVVDIIKHEKFVIGNDISTNLDTNPLQQIRKLFFRNHKMYETRYNPPLQDGDVLVTANEDRVSFNDKDVRNASDSVFCKKKADVWFMITAEVYDDTDPNNTLWPSFDLVVRGKWTQDGSE